MTKIFDLPNKEDFDPELRRAFEFADQKVDPSLIDYSKIKMHRDKIKLSGDGTFYTLQGEGPTTGLPCVFVRLHVCNLRCTWCDAWYTWNPHTKEYWTESRDVELDEVAQLIKNTWAGPDHIKRRVIWTGGEPLIQRRQISDVMIKLGLGEYLIGRPMWIHEIETNGTLMPTEVMLKFAQFNCSPKLANSDNAHHSMVRPNVLKALNEVNTTFKFVCYDETDLREIEDKYLEHISEDKIIIMPQGIRVEEITDNMRNLYEPCMKRGWRLMGRLQAQFADGARRGV